MRLPERLEIGDYPKRVKVAAEGEFNGLSGTVNVVYYDRLHTGSSYDHLTVALDSGKTIGGPANLFETIE